MVVARAAVGAAAVRAAGTVALEETVRGVAVGEKAQAMGMARVVMAAEVAERALVERVRAEVEVLAG